MREHLDGASTDGWRSAVAPHPSIPDQHRVEPVPLGVVRSYAAISLTCTDCDTTFEPTAEDFAFGRTGCPDPDCGGWTLLAELTIGGAR